MGAPWSLVKEVAANRDSIPTAPVGLRNRPNDMRRNKCGNPSHCVDGSSAAAVRP
jgi:hypothetical protein